MTINGVAILGQGYVGLPLAHAASTAGLRVLGVDTNAKTVDSLNAGSSHIDDLANADIQTMLSKGYSATTDATQLKDYDVVVICVPTPLGEAGAPDLTAVRAATKTAAENISADTLVILESTTYPGTTEEVCLPILEQYSGLKVGENLFVSFSPERVDPGSKIFGIKNTPKLIGGITPESTQRTAEFYSVFVDEVVPMSGAKEAETAKLLENTFRHVNIALVNEMAKVCHELGIDIWEVIRGAETKPFGFMKFTPGAGVGGHCIPIDPNYLSYEVRRKLGYPLRFVELAQEINNSMPKYVVNRVDELLNVKAKSMRNAKVLLLGVTYKAGIADQRQSPAIPVAEELIQRGASLKYHDPFVEKWTVSPTRAYDRVHDLKRAVEESDIVVLLQKHPEYDVAEIDRLAEDLLDTCGVTEDPARRL